MTSWLNEYGDVVTEAERECFIQDEMCADADAGNDGSREYAVTVFDSLHVPQEAK